MKIFNSVKTAGVLKTLAVRFFDLYLFIYVALITLVALSGEKCVAISVFATVLLITNTYLKFRLNFSRFYRNIGIKYTLCTFVLLLTYVILAIMSKCVAVDIAIFVMSTLALFGIYDTCMNLLQYIYFKQKKADNKECAYVYTEEDFIDLAEKKLVKISVNDKKWKDNEWDNDSLGKMLNEFFNISNDNNMGHVLVRSMSSVCEDGTERMCVKAKKGYQIIIRGEYKNIIDKCTDMISSDKLLKIDEEVKTDLLKKIEKAENKGRIVLCCAFKEVENVTDDSDDNYIFAGCAEYDVKYPQIRGCTVLADSEKSEFIKKKTEGFVEFSKDNLDTVVENLHKENKFVCGKYSRCDGETVPVVKAPLFSVTENYSKIVSFGFFCLISVVLLASNILLSLFDVEVFNCCEVLTAGILNFIFAVILSFAGEYKQRINKYTVAFIGSFAVICGYFLGRYIMLNADFDNDLFYIVTGCVMATVTLIVYTLLSYGLVIKPHKTKDFLLCVAMIIATAAYLLVPASCRVFEGYNISNVYRFAAMAVSLVSITISLIISFFARLKNKKNERKISD